MTSTSQSKSKLKILCLHGYGTNKEFMKMQTQAFRKDFEDLAEFIFVDAPYLVPLRFVLDPKVLKNLEAPPRSWTYSQTGRTYPLRQIKQGPINRPSQPSPSFASLSMKPPTTMTVPCAFPKAHRYFK